MPSRSSYWNFRQCFFFATMLPPPPLPQSSALHYTPQHTFETSVCCKSGEKHPVPSCTRQYPPPFPPSTQLLKGCRNGRGRRHIFKQSRVNLCIQQYFTLSQSRRVAPPDSHRSVPGIAHYPTQPCSWQTSVSLFSFPHRSIFCDNSCNMYAYPFHSISSVGTSVYIT